MLSQALIKISGANKGTVPGIHAPGGGAPANSPSSPPNCRSVTFPSEQRGYLRGAGAHFSGKGTEVILVWISSLFSGLKHKVGGKKKRERKTCPGRLCPQHLLPSHQQHTHCHLLKLIPTQTHAHTHTSASGHKKRLVNQTQIRTREVI